MVSSSESSDEYSSSDYPSERAGSVARRFSPSRPPRFSADTERLLRSSANADADEYHTEVDSRIEDLEQEIWVLRTSRNAVTRTCRLPIDILSEIFLQVRADDPPDAQYPAKIKRRWIRITHVCRHWRDVALDCTALWTELDLSMPGSIDTMLARSKNAPLSVKLQHSDEGFDYDFPTNALRKALSQVARLRCIDIDTDDPYVDFSPAFSAWPAEVPLLEVLNVRKTEDPLEMASDALSGHTPSLRRLTLSVSDFRWDTLPFGPRMTHLSLAGNDDSSDAQRPAWSTFSQSIAEMPLLQELHLARFLPITPPSTSGLTFSLLNLQNLYLEDMDDKLCTFFQKFRLPSAHCTTLFPLDIVHRYPLMDQLLETMKTSIWGNDPDTNAAVQCIELSHTAPIPPVMERSYPDHYLSHGMRLRFGEDTNAGDPPSEINVVVDLAKLPDNCLALCNRHFDMAPLRSFIADAWTLDSQGGDVRNAMWRMLKRRPNVHTISMRGVHKDMKQIVRELFGQLKGEATNDHAAQADLPFPALSQLVFCHDSPSNSSGSDPLKTGNFLDLSPLNLYRRADTLEEGLGKGDMERRAERPPLIAVKWAGETLHLGVSPPTPF